MMHRIGPGNRLHARGFASLAPDSQPAGEQSPLNPADFRLIVVASPYNPGHAAWSVPMPSRDPVAEFRADWLPHVTDAGLDRLITLLAKASPLLIHGAFTKAIPMGCIASHVAWNHPAT